MLEWIRFAAAAALAAAGAVVLCTSVLGVFRFKFALNRMHAASVIDSLGVLLIIASLIVAFGLTVLSLKLALVVVFLWITSPVASHLVSRLEVMTGEDLARHADIQAPAEKVRDERD